MHILVVSLHRCGRVADHATILLHLVDLGHGQARVQHVLVVANQSCIAAEFIIEAILCVGKNVLLVFESGRVRAAAIRRGTLLVLA